MLGDLFLLVVVVVWAGVFSAAEPDQYVWATPRHLHVLGYRCDFNRPAHPLLPEKALNLLEKLWNENGDKTVEEIDASIYVAVLLQERIAWFTSSQMTQLFDILIRLFSALHRYRKSFEFWQGGLKALMTAFPSAYHQEIMCQALIPQIYDPDQPQGLVPVSAIVSKLTVRFDADQMRTFLEHEIIGLATFPHLDIFVRRIPQDRRFEILKGIVSHIARHRMSLHFNKKQTYYRLEWPDHDEQLFRILRFQKLAAEFAMESDIINHLLGIARTKLDQSREHFYIALQLMMLSPTIVVSDVSLLFQLLPLSQTRFRSKRRSIRNIVRSLPSKIFSEQDDRGRTLLECYVELQDIDVPTFNIIAKNTPQNVVQRLQLEKLNVMDPQSWHILFHSMNTESIQKIGCQRFFDATLGNVQNRARIEATVVMDLIIRSGMATLHDALLEYFAVKHLADHCRNIFRSCSRSNMRSIVSILDYYKRHGRLKNVVDKFPAMFSNPTAFADFLWLFADYIVFYCSDQPIQGDCLGAKIQDITRRSLATCQNHSWLCDVFVRFFTMHFRHDVMIFERSNMKIDSKKRIPKLETSIACLYIFILSTKQFKVKSFSRITSLLDAGLERASFLIKQGKRNNSILAQSIIALTLKVAKDAGKQFSCFQLFSANLLRLPGALLKKPFQALWREPDFDRFANNLFSDNQRLKFKFLMSHGFCRYRTLPPEHPVSNYRMLPRRIKKIEDDYEIINQIGVGSYGTVYEARIGDLRVAIKKVGRRDPYADREIKFMTTFCHSNTIPGLVQLLDIAQSDYDTYLVMELLNGPRLFDWQVPDDPDSGAKELTWWAYRMLLVVHRLHEHNLAHNDLTHSANFMIEQSSNDIVLIDFGFAGEASGLSEDGPELYKRFMELLLRVKEKFQLRWYEPAPEAYRPFEEMLQRFQHRHPECNEVLSDPIFDDLRSNNLVRESLQASKFPIKPTFEPLRPDLDSVHDARVESVHVDNQLLAAVDEDLFSMLSEITPFTSSCSGFGSPFVKRRKPSVDSSSNSMIIHSEAEASNPQAQASNQQSPTCAGPSQWSIPPADSPKRDTMTGSESDSPLCSQVEGSAQILSGMREDGSVNEEKGVSNSSSPPMSQGKNVTLTTKKNPLVHNFTESNIEEIIDEFDNYLQNCPAAKPPSEAGSNGNFGESFHSVSGQSSCAVSLASKDLSISPSSQQDPSKSESSVSDDNMHPAQLTSTTEECDAESRFCHPSETECLVPSNRDQHLEKHSSDSDDLQCICPNDHDGLSSGDESLPCESETSQECESLSAPVVHSESNLAGSFRSEEDHGLGFWTTLLIWLSCGCVATAFLTAAWIYATRRRASRQPRLVDLIHSQSSVIC